MIHRVGTVVHNFSYLSGKTVVIGSDQVGEITVIRDRAEIGVQQHSMGVYLHFVCAFTGLQSKGLLFFVISNCQDFYLTSKYSIMIVQPGASNAA